MSDSMDLTGEIAEAVNGAAERGATLALGYVDGDGYPVVSFRGSTQVHSATQLALWARKPDDGLALAIADRPQVSLIYYGPGGPGAMYLSIRGVAHVDASINDEVYSAMIEGERGQDPDRKGVAIVIEVESVRGVGGDGPFEQSRTL